MYCRLLLLVGVIYVGMFTDGDAHAEDEVHSVRRHYETQVLVVGNNGSTPIERRYGEDDNLGRMHSRLQLDAKSQNLHFGIDFMFVAGCCAEPSVYHDNASSLSYDNLVLLNGLYAGVAMDRFSIQVGDFDLKIGQGMMLDLHRSDEAGFDNKLRGGQLAFTSDRFDAKLAVGVTNGLNVDPVTHGVLAAEPLDTVVAAESSLVLLNVLRIGLMGTYIDPRYSSNVAMPLDHLYVDMGPGIAVRGTGAYLDFRLGGTSVYLEGDVQTHDNYRVQNGMPVMDEFGNAIYTSLKLDFLPSSGKLDAGLEVQGVYYHQWLAEGTYRGYFSHESYMTPIKYNRVPTLEPSFVGIRSFGNVAGGRIDAEFSFRRTGATLRLGSNVMRYLGGLSPNGFWISHGNLVTLHPVALFSFATGGLSWELETGVRREHNLSPEPNYGEWGHLMHGRLLAALELPGGRQVELEAALHRNALDTTRLVGPFWLNTNRIGFKRGGVLALDLFVDYSDELDGPYDHALKYGGIRAARAGNFFARAAFSLLYFEPLELKLVAGTTRGGEYCHDGYCALREDRAEALFYLGFTN